MGQFCDPNVIFLEGVVTKSKLNCKLLQLDTEVCDTCLLSPLDSLSSVLFCRFSFSTASPLMIVIEFMSNGSLDNYLKVSIVQANCVLDYLTGLSDRTRQCSSSVDFCVHLFIL